MKITRLDHIQLAMPKGEEAKARQFFIEILGLSEIQKPEPLASRGGCWFEGQNLQLHLGVEEAFRPARKAHPGFAVDDLEALAKRLTVAGFEAKWDNSIPSVKRFHSFDPFGNRLEFLRDGDSLTP